MKDIPDVGNTPGKNPKKTHNQGSPRHSPKPDAWDAKKPRTSSSFPTNSNLKGVGPNDLGNGKKVLFAIFTVAILVALAYFFIPTVNADVRVLYFEGAAGAINVDSKLKNDGNTALVNFELGIIVVDSNDKVIQNVTHTLSRAEARTSYSFDNIYFKGDHYETYHIIINIEFMADGDTYSAQYSHETDEYMRITYDHSVP